jgi:hypothetical protein
MKWLAVIAIAIMGGFYFFDTGTEPDDYGYTGPCPDKQRAWLIGTNRLIDSGYTTAQELPDYETGEGGAVELLEEEHTSQGLRCRYAVYAFGTWSEFQSEPNIRMRWTETGGWRAE